jgi:Tfp pilus assembly protein PilX
MSAGTIVAIVVVVIIVAALIAFAAFAARRRRLQQRFGPEYDRAVEGSDSRRQAEAELAEREKRVKRLDIRPLDPAARASYLAQWTNIQQQFVDSPTEAVAAAQSLITTVMADRGYPTEDVDQITADLSVDHAETLGHFRTAQDISGRVAEGTASTEDLRQAMVHYRTLFQDLLGEDATDGIPADLTQPAPAGSSAADYPVTGPAAGPDYAEAQEMADQPDVTEPDPLPDRPAGRHHAVVTDSDAGVPEASSPASGAYADQAELDDPDAEPAAASRLPWRK